MLKANILLLYLKRLTILTGGGGNMDYANLDVDEGMRNFVREMEYDEPKVALFLLGYLIGEIGNAQYREGNSKPILGKITYQGMNQNKLVRLLNDVFEKLTQYKSGGKPLLHYSEGIFAECKRLLDKTIQEPLSDQENVFYVLSGYAYATHQAIKASQSKEAKKEEEVETNE
jgi:CRISPR-associated protein Csh1